VVRRRSDRGPVAPGDVLTCLEQGLAALEVDPFTEATLVDAAAKFERADAMLRGIPGLQCLLGAPDLVAATDDICNAFRDRVATIERALDDDGTFDGPALEYINAAVIRVKDACWTVQRDRLRNARAVADLAGSGARVRAIEGYASIQVALSALDRLEVRGRDSAGLHVLVRGHNLDLDAPGPRALLERRAADPLFRSGAVRVADGCLSFVYKAAAEIGELGDNTNALRATIVADELLRLALSSDDADATVLGHTRWASVGIISQSNAHPLNSDEDGRMGPYVVGALNGDVDNFADLKAAEGLRLAVEITTDAKVIPTLVSRRVGAGNELGEAFRSTVSGFEGSVAIAANAADAPERLLLALRGSGQALYVGVADDCYVVASEPYGLIEETSRYLRMDGETAGNRDNPTASRGQIVVLDGARAGTIEGIERFSYDGTPLPLTEADLVTAEVTTRDIDRGNHAHFLLKEITESPGSFRKTLRGKIVDGPDGVSVALSDGALPDSIRADLANGALSRVIAIGQGTAHVAGQSFAAALESMTQDTPLRVEARLATELSGFGLRDDMSDSLVIAISQSGTTTDTNRTVDVVRARGGRVIAIVNRRHSDLTDKADGVLYTSDGRDLEMSVASTKALYAQIAAGFLLSAAIADAVGGTVDSEIIEALRALPDAMEEVIARRPQIAAVAQQFAPARRYWAIVGNGTNRIAANELRIKLSELCYKAIACDSTEDKKHIDLSSEPLILVCAAGLTGSTADDVAKEIAIFRAHKATPIIIASEGDERFGAAVEAIKVPPTHPRLAFVLSAMAGHLFGYEAALAIDAQARPLREARAAIEAAVSSPDGLRADGDRLLRRLRHDFGPMATRFFDGLRAGAYDGHLEASTAVRVASLFRYALGITPLDAYQAEYGKIGTPSVVVDDLTAALTRAIEELTRPIDAIKHQAKTVTVGISRSDESLLGVPLVAAVLGAGAPRDALSYQTLRTLAELDPAVEEVTGWIRYRIDGDPSVDDEVAVSVVDRGGIAAEIPSRAERDPVLRGTKHSVAVERRLLVARGRRDGRTVVIIPETKDDQCTGLSLLHVRFEDRLPVVSARAVLQGYRNRYAALKDAVTETEPSFREDLLGELAVVDLLTSPIHELADRWRH
jgi:glucosamine--fructose-6-phosphate aminotransferase (isomerizing)